MNLKLILLLSFCIYCNGLKFMPTEHNLHQNYHYEISNDDNMKISQEMDSTDFHPYTALKAKQLYTIAIPKIFNKDEHQHLYKKGGINYAHELTGDQSTENTLSYEDPSTKMKYYPKPSMESELQQPIIPLHYDKDSQYSLSSETQLHSVYESPRYIVPSMQPLTYATKQTEAPYRNNYNQQHYSPANEVSHVKFNGMGVNYEF